MERTVKEFKKILVANRGEIAIRVLRAAAELNRQTVAIYTYEDRYSLHRYKADEAYLIGPEDQALKPYLDIEEIIYLALEKGVDAIHPGYGFLSENVEFVRRCKENGITFIGPSAEVMQALGDKIRAKEVARKASVPVIEDARVSADNPQAALKEAERIGYPLIIKAAAGGGGRGMRVVRDKNQLEGALVEAKSEAERAFGDGTLFLEKFIENPRHLEVQLLGDNYGNIVHLFERDCSIQRRFQKVVEVAPAPGLNDTTREKLYEYALKIGKAVGYQNAGTVEFLVDKEGSIYFIEVNPRIQVEHTVTEEITGIDIVRSQILIAEGRSLDSKGIYLKSQQDVKRSGFAIQCRITTEDPANDFKPDYGRVIAYRSPGGFGIRLDAGSAYSGVTISPFFDSLLVKVTSSGRTLRGAAERLHRALREFRIRGVTTNIQFLKNVISHPVFLKGKARVKFLEDHAEVFDFKPGRDRANKALRYLAEVIVNGNPSVKGRTNDRIFYQPVVPEYDRHRPPPDGAKQLLDQLGPEKFCEHLLKDKAIHYTDTTLRDAHQSLLATRVRTIDMLEVARSFAHHHPEVFSMEVWGGATFDVALRFLHECPWERLRLLREAVPNILLQMLLRGSNAVGYSAYPDNVIEKFVETAWQNGIDVFRIFDSMNWIEAVKVSIQAVRKYTGALAEASICYSGDICDPERRKFTLQYYLDRARELEDAGAHIIAIKDMAGLLKPDAAALLIERLKEQVNLPIHLHTHDTSSIQAATYLSAVNAGVDIIDVALSSMSGLTSQPNFNSIVEMLRGHPRERPVDIESLNRFSAYWEKVREYYYPFESGLKTGTAEVYRHEIPGGQYSNLRPQARALGLEDRFEEIKENYIVANRMLGDLIKVTPSSKVVGDLALFMTSNNLTEADIFERGEELAFPESLKSFFRGELGQPYGGFPEKLQKIVLKDEKPYTDRPNDHVPAVDMDKGWQEFQREFPDSAGFTDYISYLMYPAVYRDYYRHVKTYGRVANIPTPQFFYGLKPDQEVMFDIDQGKRLIVRYVYMTEPDSEGIRTVYFKLNGQTRGIDVRDQSVQVTKKVNRKAENPGEVGSPLQGKLSRILVAQGEKVQKGQPLFVIEAMKMETTVPAASDGSVKELVLSEGEIVEQNDLVVVLGE
ncbi:MAG: pyruvate carboxylase [Candidatus Dadabacteria bacterium]|nr:MAG: pyruvate carboxylase [Candidatus Dadabacteria bacterium]